MNGGDSDTDLLLLNRAGGRLEPWATLPAPGGEDAEFFTIGDRSFLAVASIRTGAGPYQFAATSHDLRMARGPVRPLPGSADVRGQAVEALADRRQALPRAGPGGDRPARARAGPGATGTRSSTSGTARRSPNSSGSPRSGPTTGTRSRPAASSSSRTPSTPARASCTAGTAPGCGRTRRWPPSPAARSPPSTTATRPTSSSPASPPRPGCCAWDGDRFTRRPGARRPRRAGSWR